MTRFVGLEVSQKLTAICVVEETGRRLWRGQCATDPGQIEWMVSGHAGRDARIGVETGPMTPWLVHELRACRLDVVCLDARHASAAFKMQMNKTDQNDAEGLAQIMRTGWYRPVHMKSLDAYRARALDDVAQRHLLAQRFAAGPSSVISRPADAGQPAHPFHRKPCSRRFALRARHRLDVAETRRVCGCGEDAVTPGPSPGRREPSVCCKAPLKKSRSSCC